MFYEMHVQTKSLLRKKKNQTFPPWTIIQLCECALQAHLQLVLHQNPQVFPCGTGFNLLIPQPVLILGIASTQMQDLGVGLGLVEPHDLPIDPLLEHVHIPLDGSMSMRYVNYATKHGSEVTMFPQIRPISESQCQQTHKKHNWAITCLFKNWFLNNLILKE